VVHVDEHLGEGVDLLLTKEALTDLVEDLLGCLNLAD
jgi:hypothetical protein